MTSTDNNHGKRATIRGVATAAGVSIATVSRVLNGRPDVAPETREIVLRAVREQGFTTNRNARALSGGRTGLIGVTLPLVEADYFGVILSGASEALYEQDMRIVLCPTLHQHDREVNLLDRLMRGRTCLLITHSPRLARTADQIIELDHGRIVQTEAPVA